MTSEIEIKSQKKCDNRPIGIFDSGLGGLTVTRAIHRSLPAESLVYLGDTARVPYGDKSPDTIQRFAREDVRFLLSKGVKLIVVACNTVSAVAMEAVRETAGTVPVIGVLDAGVFACLSLKPQSISVIGTKATIHSDAYRRAIHALHPEIMIQSIATPLFVPMVEEGIIDTPIADAAIRYYLNSVLQTPSDILLLGCTHYPLLRDKLQKILPAKTQIVDSAQACADYVLKYLNEAHCGATPDQTQQPRFAVTDMASDFVYQATRFFGEPIRHVERVHIDTQN